MSEPMLLSGVRVLDVGSYIAGPAAATVMADLGADVIKVEPKEGDPYRQLGRLPGAPPEPPQAWWHQDARSKRSLCLDIKQARGRDILLQLVQRSDVFLTNYRPDLVARLQLRWDDLKPLNRRLIYASLSGYGDTGEDANDPAFDATAWWARGGLMDVVRTPGNVPVSSAPGMGDHATAMALFGAIMAGLYQRERTGRGTRVSTSLLANGVWSNSMLLALVLAGTVIPDRNRAPPPVANALALPYQSRDGAWLMLTMLNEAKEWLHLVEVLEAPQLASDPRFAGIADRRVHAPALAELLRDAFARFDKTVLRARMKSRAITHGFANTLNDLPNDAQLHAAGILTPLAEPADGITHVVASPVWFEGFAKRTPQRAPRVGEHNDEILRELGLEDDTVRELRRDGIVG